MNMMISRQPKQALEPVHLTKFEAVNNNVQQVLMIIMMRVIMKVMMIIKMIIMMTVMMKVMMVMTMVRMITIIEK